MNILDPFWLCVLICEVVIIAAVVILATIIETKCFKNPCEAGRSDK